MQTVNHNIGKQKGFTIRIGIITITWIRLNNKYRFTLEISKGE